MSFSSPGRGRAAWRALAAGVALLWAAPAAAQVPPPVPPVGRDTSDLTARFLQADSTTRTWLDALRRPGTDNLLPPRSRVVFTRDSIEWANAGSVADLLQRIPGVYLLRGGWIGQPELPILHGQGPRSTEYFLDGLPYLPIGADSASVDPSLLPLSFYEAVEVERLPGRLRIHLYTRRHDRLSPRTRVAVTTGDLDVSRYEALIEKRFSSGLGFTGSFEFLGIRSREIANENAYQNGNGWLQVSWVPTPRSGVSVQYFLSGPRRLPGFGSGAAGATDTLSRGLDESRRDLQARAYLRQRTDGLGGGLALVAGRTSWGAEDTLSRRLSQVGVEASYRLPTASAALTALRRWDWTTLDLLGTVGAAPTRFLALSAELGRQQHTGDRRSEWLTARGGVQLPLGFQVNGTWRTGEVVDFPMDRDAGPRRVRDLSVTGGFDLPAVGVEVGYARTGPSAPLAFWTYPALGAVGTAERTEWLTLRLRLRPRNWITLDGWYSDPVGPELREGQPPNHSAVTFAIHSKFLRVFPSGFFDLKAGATVESFGSGTLGRTAEGDPVRLPGTTFVRAQLQLQFGSFTAYLDRNNLFTNRQGYVPGLRMPVTAQSFGIRWVFWN